MAGMSVLNHNADLKCLYSMGIGKRNSGTNEGMEYGVVGMSGYFKPDWDSRDSTTNSRSNIALKHAYVVYRCDATDDDFQEIGNTNDSFVAGANDVFSVGRTLFPEYMSGEFKFDSTTGKFGGYSVNFPDDFNIVQYFKDENIDVNLLIERSGLIGKLKSRKISNTLGSKIILDAFVESVNIQFMACHCMCGIAIRRLLRCTATASLMSSKQ